MGAAAAACGFELAGASAPLGVGVGVGGPRASKGESTGAERTGRRGDRRARQSTMPLPSFGCSDSEPVDADGDEHKGRSRKLTGVAGWLAAHVKARQAVTQEAAWEIVGHWAVREMWSGPGGLPREFLFFFHWTDRPCRPRRILGLVYFYPKTQSFSKFSVTSNL